MRWFFESKSTSFAHRLEGRPDRDHEEDFVSFLSNDCMFRNSLSSMSPSRRISSKFLARSADSVWSLEDKSRNLDSTKYAIEETTSKPRTLSPACTYERDNRSDILTPLLKHVHPTLSSHRKSSIFANSSSEIRLSFPIDLF